jgi:hypothetical protein
MVPVDRLLRVDHPSQTAPPNRLSASKKPNRPILASANHAITYEIPFYRRMRATSRAGPSIAQISNRHIAKCYPIIQINPMA